MTITEMENQQVKGALCSLRFYYHRTIEVEMKVPRWWLRERLEGMDTYNEWFNGLGLPFVWVFVVSPTNDLQNNIIRMEATGKVVAEFIINHCDLVTELRIHID